MSNNTPEYVSNVILVNGVPRHDADGLRRPSPLSAQEEVAPDAPPRSGSRSRFVENGEPIPVMAPLGNAPAAGTQASSDD